MTTRPQIMRVRVISIWVLSLVLLLASTGARTQESAPTEYQLKAAFLFNFAKFIEWPPEAFPAKNSPFVFGVLGQNPFGDDLQQAIHGKTINNRSLQFKEYHSVTEVTNCHILFIGTSEKPRLPEILDDLHGKHVLTVGDTDGFVQAGGMINFLTEGNKIRFEISNVAATKAGLKISSKLLSLASQSAR